MTILNRRRFLATAAAAASVPSFSEILHADTPKQHAAAVKPRANKPVTDTFKPLPAGAVTIDGWLGGRMKASMDRRVMAQDIGRFTEPYAKRNNGSWESEYWGKWYTSAVFGYLYQPTAEHKAKIDAAAHALIQTQTPDGQLTGFDATRQYGKDWDIWGRKYALLGLIAHYDATGDAQSLAAVRKAADAIADRVDAGLVIGDECLAAFLGVQSTSILAEFAMLYARTGDQRYRKVAETIVKQWDIPNSIAPKGLRLMSDALADKTPVQIGALKCYETNANYEGLLELYRATGDERYFKSASMYIKNTLEYERMVHGSVSNNELWFDGVKNQTGVLEQPVETCATAQWMLNCWQMLRLTGDSKYADELELSLYNALLGVMTPDGHWWSYFSHLNGERIPCPIQHREQQMACCVTSGPRGLMLTPQWAVMKAKDGIAVNLYAPGSATVELDGGNQVAISQETTYPETESVKLSIAPSKPARFKLRLRIPAWSKETKLMVNGQNVACEPGRYAEIERAWQTGDHVELALDMRCRAIKAPSGAPELALARGPVLLALDSRLAKIDNSAIFIDTDDDGYVAIKPAASPSPDFWMQFEVPVYTHRGAFNTKRKSTQIFCDYPSAGSQFLASNAFRTWLPQPMYLATAFPPDIWKLAYGNNRPATPSFEQSSTQPSASGA